MQQQDQAWSHFELDQLEQGLVPAEAAQMMCEMTWWSEQYSQQKLPDIHTLSRSKTIFSHGLAAEMITRIAVAASHDLSSRQGRSAATIGRRRIFQAIREIYLLGLLFQR